MCLNLQGHHSQLRLASQVNSKSWRWSDLFNGVEVKLKSSEATYPTGNAKSLACDTANEHALTCTRETCSFPMAIIYTYI